MDTIFQNPRFPTVPGSSWEVPSDVPLFPEYTKKLGYQTAFYGKWHLGNAYFYGRPAAKGFDYSLYAPSGEPDSHNKTDHCSRGNYYFFI